jgi:formylmethanofuran dehydrogenase subunit B
LTFDLSLVTATCLGCGCTCDDIEVRIEANRILEARRACPLGQSWFGDGNVPARVRVAGTDAPMDAAIDAAAGALAGAARPLIYLAADISCEAQREGIATADGLRARLASLTSSGALPSVLAAQEQGRASATLGEIRNRADVLVFWGVDPAVRYPRYWTRYAPEPIGLHTPEGRRSRTVVAVDVGEARGPADADVRFEVSPEREVAVLTMLAASVAKAPGPAGAVRDRDLNHEQIAATLQGGRYVALVVDAEGDDAARPVDPGRAAALIALAEALNATTRCALSTLRGGGNRSGADACTTSQTGYPASVDFARGYPRYRPYDLWSGGRGVADVVLVLGSAEAIPRDALAAIRDARQVVVGPRASTGPLAGAEVTIDTGVAGIHDGGTGVRMDDIALPLRPALTGPTTAVAVIRQLRDRVRLRLGPDGPAAAAGGSR